MEILEKSFKLFLSAHDINAQIKEIVKESGVEYSDVANYLLERISQRLDIFLNRYELGFRKYERLMDSDYQDKNKVIDCAQKCQRLLTNYLIALTDVVFFVFNSNRQINTTLKLQKIMNTIILYAKRHGAFSKDKSSFKFYFIINLFYIYF